jgi:O-6-methylguanine DNA methyltransferase
MGVDRCQIRRSEFTVNLWSYGGPNDGTTSAGARLGTTWKRGETTTYGELAAALADGTTAYEIGQAVGRNPVSIVIPCHRVVGKDGALTGYAGGLKRKRFLLDLEAPVPATAGRLF